MSFPLGSLRGDGSAALAGSDSSAENIAPRWRQQALLIVGALAWLLFVLALLTHQAGDVAFTTSGTGEALRNKAGLLGARISDVALFLFGYSAWWLVPVALRAWLSALAVMLRGVAAVHAPTGCSGWAWRCCSGRVARWSGRACTAGSRCCLAMQAARWVTRWALRRCIGWAAGDPDNWWQPGLHWPFAAASVRTRSSGL